jgi:hypothetical protein
MSTSSDGFGSFFRRYTKTWMHAVATAGLTAFGMLTFVHRGFVVLALACYIVPPIVLYVTRERSGAGESASATPTDAALADEGEITEPTDDDSVASADDGAPTIADAEPTAEIERSESATEPASITEQTANSEPDTDAEPGSVGGSARAPEDDTGDETELRWRAIDVPTDATLHDVAVADSKGVAVGDGGVVLGRSGDTGEWTTVLEDGPGAGGEALSGVDVTDGGAAAWTVGSGGALARLELGSGRHTDYSAPDGRTDNLVGVAVAGTAADETVLAINGSGEVLRGRYRDGDLVWSDPVTPGSGSSLADAVLTGEVGYCCDTDDEVFATDDGGRSFEVIGLDGADGTLTGIAADSGERCHVCTDAGVVHRFDGSTWTPERVCEESLSGIDRHGECLVVCTAGGEVYERTEPATDWTASKPDSTGLEGVAADDRLAVAVGADGTVIERC